jgi:hypothetical protein
LDGLENLKDIDKLAKLLYWNNSFPRLKIELL